jgi:hypothetical protein
LAVAIFFASAICSGSNRIEIGDFVVLWRSRMDLSSVLDGFGGLPSGSCSQIAATECFSKYSAASRSDWNLGKGSFAGVSLFFLEFVISCGTSAFHEHSYRVP